MSVWRLFIDIKLGLRPWFSSWPKCVGWTPSEEVWASEYRSLCEARENIRRYLTEYNHDRPHRGVENRMRATWPLQF